MNALENKLLPKSLEGMFCNFKVVHIAIYYTIRGDIYIIMVETTFCGIFKGHCSLLHWYNLVISVSLLFFKVFVKNIVNSSGIHLFYFIWSQLFLNYEKW